jgi:hypothetical protein
LAPGDVGQAIAPDIIARIPLQRSARRSVLAGPSSAGSVRSASADGRRPDGLLRSGMEAQPDGAFRPWAAPPRNAGSGARPRCDADPDGLGSGIRLRAAPGPGGVKCRAGRSDRRPTGNRPDVARINPCAPRPRQSRTSHAGGPAAATTALPDTLAAVHGRPVRRGLWREPGTLARSGSRAARPCCGPRRLSPTRAQSRASNRGRTRAAADRPVADRGWRRPLASCGRPAQSGPRDVATSPGDLGGGQRDRDRRRSRRDAGADPAGCRAAPTTGESAARQPRPVSCGIQSPVEGPAIRSSISCDTLFLAFIKCQKIHEQVESPKSLSANGGAVPRQNAPVTCHGA